MSFLSNSTSFLRSFYLLFSLLVAFNLSAQTEKVRLAIAGMSHGHVHWILNEMDRPDVEVVGIYENDKELVERFASRYGFSMSLVYDSLSEMIKETDPEAIAAFGPTFDHLAVVRASAPAGIDVMVEKPLAVNMEHATEIANLAKRYGTQVITNYETSWYRTNEKAYEMVQQGDIGTLRKVVVHDGHEGPMEIGVGPEFLSWLTDPKLNGGGAVTDFGCYGANLITWLTNGVKPESVSATLQTFKKDIYPQVDDEATIVLQYPKMQGIVQASWNWPFSRKDMEVYGQTGQIMSQDRYNLSYRLQDQSEATSLKLEDRDYPYDDPFSLFAAVVRKTINLPAFDPYTLENNLIVVEILDAAKESAKTGARVYIDH